MFVYRKVVEHEEPTSKKKWTENRLFGNTGNCPTYNKTGENIDNLVKFADSVSDEDLTTKIYANIQIVQDPTNPLGKNLSVANILTLADPADGKPWTAEYKEAQEDNKFLTWTSNQIHFYDYTELDVQGKPTPHTIKLQVIDKVEDPDNPGQYTDAEPVDFLPYFPPKWNDGEEVPINKVVEKVVPVVEPTKEEPVKEEPVEEPEPVKEEEPKKEEPVAEEPKEEVPVETPAEEESAKEDARQEGNEPEEGHEEEHKEEIEPIDEDEPKPTLSIKDYMKLHHIERTQCPEPSFSIDRDK